MVFTGTTKGPALHRRVITFVDGTNLLVRLADQIEAEVRADAPSEKALELGCALIDRLHRLLDERSRVGTLPPDRPSFAGRAFNFLPIRTVWFGSFRGNDDQRDRIARALRANGVEARLFRQHGEKNKGNHEKEKGVDMGVAREMLINAFHANMDIALLLTGDEDYVDLVGDVKRYGVEVWGGAFDSGRSERLELACDSWTSLTKVLSGSAPLLTLGEAVAKTGSAAGSPRTA